MNKQKKLKKELQDKYSFQQKISLATAEVLLSNPFPNDIFVEAAMLQVGVVRLDAVIYRSNGRYQMGYDLMVKDITDGLDWFCYESLSDEVHFDARNLEREMFRVLDRAMEQFGLSYTECRFPKFSGTVHKTKQPI